MNPNFKNIVALVTCWIFLAGNIAYDLFDKNIIHCDDSLAKDYSYWYFAPQSIMVFALIWVGKDLAERQRRRIKAQWFFFYVLALGDVVKNILFNPVNFSVAEYWYFIVAVSVTLMKFYHHKSKHK